MNLFSCVKSNDHTILKINFMNAVPMPSFDGMSACVSKNSLKCTVNKRSVFQRKKVYF